MASLVRRDHQQRPVSFRFRVHRGLVVAIAVLALVFAALDFSLAQPFGLSDLSSTASSTASLALAAMGETLVIVGAGLDLSAGAVLSLSNCLFVTHVAASPGAAVLWSVIAIAAGGIAGAVNGFFVAYVRLQPVVVTLATMFITQGVTLLVMKQPGGTVPPTLRRRCPETFWVATFLCRLSSSAWACSLGALSRRRDSERRFTRWGVMSPRRT